MKAGSYLSSKIRSIEELFDSIEFRSAERPVQFEVIQLKALLYMFVWNNVNKIEVFWYISSPFNPLFFQKPKPTEYETTTTTTYKPTTEYVTTTTTTYKPKEYETTTTTYKPTEYETKPTTTYKVF